MAWIKSKSDLISLNPLLAVILLSSLGSALLLGWQIRYSAYGIDFTDESFYLNWIYNPFIYSWSTSQFGFVYYPLYSILGADIASLRQVNILIIYGLAWSLFYFFLVSLCPEIKDKRLSLLVLSAGLATSVFIIFSSWLLTPSYNSLALKAILISSIGLMLSDQSANRSSFIGWVLIGAGGFLAFMAKPSTAAALAASVFIYLLLARKLSIRMLALSMACACALLLISALAIDGSVSLFIERIQFGIKFYELLGAGHTVGNIFRLDSFQLTKEFEFAFVLVFGMLLTAILCIWTKNKKYWIVSFIISFVFFCFTAESVFIGVHRAAGLGQYQGLLVFTLSFAVVAAVMLLGKLEALVTISASQWSVAALFLAMPHIYAFGTNSNYWQVGSFVAIFWLLAGLSLTAPLIRKRASYLFLFPLAFATQAVTAALLQTGFERPYRQPQSVRINTSIQEFGPQHSKLVLSYEYASYINSVVTISREAGFEPTMPMIDLTGQSPGILYALGADSIGHAWTVGGYPGSLKLAEATFKKVSCEKIASAWLLLEPEGPRSVPINLLETIGLNFPGDYKKVGSWYTAEGAGGFKSPRIQKLFKPVNFENSLALCNAIRIKKLQ